MAPGEDRSAGWNANRVLMRIERRDWNVAADANSQRHDVVRDCGMVHGERDIVPASPYGSLLLCVEKIARAIPAIGRA